VSSLFAKKNFKKGRTKKSDRCKNVKKMGEKLCCVFSLFLRERERLERKDRVVNEEVYLKIKMGKKRWKEMEREARDQVKAI